MKKCLLSLLLAFLLSPIIAQSDSLNTDSIHRRNWPILGFIPMKNVNIHGIAAGPWSPVDETNATYNGLTVELVGLGFLVPLGYGTATVDDVYRKNLDESYLDSVFKHHNHTEDYPSGTHNGTVISPLGAFTGSINGLHISGFGSSIEHINGASIVAGIGVCRDMKGFSFACINFAGSVEGLQIGIFNKTARLKGLQIGLWNINHKRALPFINWNF